MPVKKVVKQKEESFNAVINKMKNLIYKEAMSFKRKYNLGDLYEVEDLVQEGYIVLMECIKKHDSEKGAFTTFLTTCLRNHYYQMVKKECTIRFESVEELVELEDSRLQSNHMYTNPSFLRPLSKSARMLVNLVLDIPNGINEQLKEVFDAHYKEPDTVSLKLYLGLGKGELEAIKNELLEKLIVL